MDNFDAPEPLDNAVANPAETPLEAAQAIENALAWNDQTGNGIFGDVSPMVADAPAMEQAEQQFQDAVNLSPEQTGQLYDALSQQENELIQSEEDMINNMSTGDAGPTLQDSIAAAEDSPAWQNAAGTTAGTPVTDAANTDAAYTDAANTTAANAAPAAGATNAG